MAAFRTTLTWTAAVLLVGIFPPVVAVDITFVPADFRLGNFTVDGKYEITDPPTTNATCADDNGSPQCSGTVSFDLSTSTTFRTSIAAPDGYEIYFDTTGGTQEANASTAYNPFSFQAVLRHTEKTLGSPICGDSQLIRFPNMTVDISGTKVEGLEMIAMEPNGWWTSEVEITNCDISMKAVFGGPYQTYRFKELAWSVTYDPSMLDAEPQFYNYSTRYTYGSVWSSQGSIKIVEEGGEPQPDTSGEMALPGRGLFTAASGMVFALAAYIFV